MAGFDYLAVDARGHSRQGSLTAPDEAQARALLERRRLTPVRLSPSTGQAGSDVAAGSRGSDRRNAAPMGSGRMGAGQLALLTRQLATLVTVAPVEEAVRTLALQSEKPAQKRLLLNVHAGVLEGRRLSDAMRREPRAFPPLYRAMVAAGEGSGALAPILERLAEMQEREQAIRGKVVTALVYPAVLAVVALLVIAILMTFVVPQVVDQFESMGQTLPLLTRLVIGVSDLMRGWGWLMLILAALAGLGFVLARRREGFRLATDAVALRLPLVGPISRNLHAARMARTLSIMLASGLPVLEGLTITARTVSNTVLRRSTEAMAEAVREGGGLSAAMRRAEVFPPILVYMTASGEAGGRLEPMLDRAAEYLEREFANVTAVMLSLLEPAIIVFMGGMVALIVLSILLPILQINTLTLG